MEKNASNQENLGKGDASPGSMSVNPCSSSSPNTGDRSLEASGYSDIAMGMVFQYPSSSVSTSTASLNFDDQTASLNSLNWETVSRAESGHSENARTDGPSAVVLGHFLSMRGPKSGSVVDGRPIGMLKTGPAGMGQPIVGTKLPKSTDSRPRHTLKESSTANYPCTIHLPDGEEMYWGRYRNFRLRSPEEELAMTDTVIRAPPNVTVDRNVCENLYWNEQHCCQGDAGGFPSSPPPYNFLALDDDMSPKNRPLEHPSKTGKFKEAIASLVRSVLPSSRSSYRKPESKIREGKSSPSRTAPEGVKKTATSAVTVNRYNTRNSGSNQMASSPGGSFSRYQDEGYLSNGPSLPDAPPTYEKAARDKKRDAE